MKPLDEMRSDELNSTIGTLQLLRKRIDHALALCKGEYLRTHESDAPSENCRIGQTDAATIRVTKGGDGGYTVTDPVAYANWLHDTMQHVPGGAEAWRTVNYPTPEAMAAAYVNHVATHTINEDGELPAGVEWKPGRGQSVVVTLNRTALDMPLDTAHVMELMTGLKELES